MTLTATQMAIMSAISTVAKIGSSFMQSSGQSAGAGMQAELARRQAAREAQIGAMQAAQQRERNKRIEGTQRALLAGATGGDASTGSALLVQPELAEEGEFSARILENNAAALVNAALAEEVLQRSRMNQFNQAGLMRAGSALLKGGSQIAQLKF